MNPYLLYQFANSEGSLQEVAFSHPVTIITAYKLEQVQPAFAKAEEALNQGRFVAGYVSYEAAPAFDEAFKTYSKTDWPLVWFGVFEHPHDGPEPDEGNFHVSDWKLDGRFSDYQKGIDAIKEAIEQGNTYQVNYTSRLKAHFEGNDYSFFKQLAANQHASYSAYLQLGERRILSASPELFFRMDGNKLTTKPMKGTAKRGRWTEEDQRLASELTLSEKDKAENLMIVDLLRNDLGRMAVPGTVQVPRLFELETYPTVHQMTSTIQAALPRGVTMYEIFQALFPCGSITGAPKVRTMQYIAELETAPRNVYCGAIGFMTPEREAVFNVPIRTVMLDHGSKEAVYGSGAGLRGIPPRKVSLPKSRRRRNF
ncbi:aminodeoxychorismate synthase component I [Halobacillus salinarum]|uniref:aminodeoxychorismate synthase component I n=1 Tax=Halobacillus salinarum TaxID=2932257 RepID=UPI002961F374|nr:aminodeoxychorismate synthase component I [Halobacillus salinarum]